MRFSIVYTNIKTIFGFWKIWEKIKWMKIKRKNRKKWKVKEIKNKVKVHKLFLYNTSNIFDIKLNNLKTHKFLINFKYIWFFLYFLWYN